MTRRAFDCLGTGTEKSSSPSTAASLNLKTLRPPGIDQMEHSVIGPDALLDLLINTDAFRLAITRLE